MSGRITLPGKYLSEAVFARFDFTSQLAVGETISSASVTASVWSGTDPSPSAIVSGAASISGAVVRQLIIQGVLGVVYELLCTAITSLGQSIEISAYQAVVPDLP